MAYDLFLSLNPLGPHRQDSCSIPCTEYVVDLTEDNETYVEFFYTAHWEEDGKVFRVAIAIISHGGLLFFNTELMCYTSFLDWFHREILHSCLQERDCGVSIYPNANCLTIYQSCVSFSNITFE
ncbi:hypothetical protein TorRG33x02_304650 [Trema orientale]|uniref:Uncharacterized protein n=1 Tax=Trema orientale TaxID=63057 RepID=A0A2P5BY30_TREOI|nr:hypothetical protein TorRG33x02_304650 [Trema orientale]